MKIVVYGTGGVGGYFGGKLAKAGFNTTLIARGEHLKAIKKNGLFVRSIYGDFHVNPTFATSDVREVKNPDLILLATKNWQIPEVSLHLREIIHKETMVLPLQNGVNATDKLVEVLSEKNVLAGLCRIISFIEGPGKIWHKAFHPQILFGELDNSKTQRIKKVKAIFDAADFDNQIPGDIQLEQWRKFLFIATISGIGSITRMEIGVNRADKGIRQIMEETAQEIKALANAKGVALSDTDIAQTFAAIDKQAPNTTASMQRDIMNGKPSELDDFNGYVVKESKKYGLKSPVNSFIYTCLKPMEKMARKS
ncbi:2-dehydropantoate 2-reductase [Ascidiimonas sp. W6]|uniref:ketopantoate reductase family protein n=1 Tax=Ascidiimonas meishanensis TaxID=3128903 RepID=UPI0030EF3809